MLVAEGREGRMDEGGREGRGRRDAHEPGLALADAGELPFELLQLDEDVVGRGEERPRFRVGLTRPPERSKSLTRNRSSALLSIMLTAGWEALSSRDAALTNSAL